MKRNQQKSGKKTIVIIAAAMIGCAVPVYASGKTDVSVEGTYSIHIQADDWNCGTSRAILTLDQPVDNVQAGDFHVTETKMDTDWSNLEAYVGEFERNVGEAYLSDENGNRAENASRYVTLELPFAPNTGCPLFYSPEIRMNTWSDPYYLTITLDEQAGLTTAEGEKVAEFCIDKEYTECTTSADNMELAAYESSFGITYQYGAYVPEESADTLVVWLHGLGEGGVEGTYPRIIALSAKASVLMEKEFQDRIGGAYVLYPQCPTYWMDSDGQQKNFHGGGIQSDGTSFYTESLHELITYYKEQCGAKKVVIAGCSNGGFMTMLLAENYGDEYDAFVPICESLPDKFITDEQIEKLKDLPMYFIYSENDPVVDPALHEIPTVERLRKAGASDLCVSVTEAVSDTTGRFQMKDGSPYQYSGHFSWIYFFNNQSVCKEDGISAWDWIADHVQGE